MPGIHTAIHKDRLRHWIAPPIKPGKYVLYWMQQAQRVAYNHALAHAVEISNTLCLPLVVGFVLTSDFPDANLRHYVFMLEGIAQTQSQLGKLGISFVLKVGDMVEEVFKLSRDAAWVVADVGYLRIQRQWRAQVANALKCPYTEVETDVTVPVAAAAAKEASAARTLRPLLMNKLGDYLDPVVLPEYRMRQTIPKTPHLDSIDPIKLADRVVTNKNISPVNYYHGGPAEARQRLKKFISQGLAAYHVLSRDPTKHGQSDLSPYLHFGQISPVEIVREIQATEAPPAAKKAFIEQMVVRRELAVNFVYYNPGYDMYEQAVPHWAQKTLAEHIQDPRPYIYTWDQLEQGNTHDPYWNAAQMEMVKTGKMHNYMRMYWGKKIMEWTRTPQEAHEIILALNNRYELDGRDPNGFTGAAWCFGRHDRPWQERAIFGKVRYMNAEGLKRKFRINEYVQRIQTL